MKMKIVKKMRRQKTAAEIEKVRLVRRNRGWALLLGVPTQLVVATHG
jgi:hypothetical protein